MRNAFASWRRQTGYPTTRRQSQGDATPLPQGNLPGMGKVEMVAALSVLCSVGRLVLVLSANGVSPGVKWSVASRQLSLRLGRGDASGGQAKDVGILAADAALDVVAAAHFGRLDPLGAAVLAPLVCVRLSALHVVTTPLVQAILPLRSCRLGLLIGVRRENGSDKVSVLAILRRMGLLHWLARVWVHAVVVRQPAGDGRL
ncbi:hypothetical protein TCAP_00901 [Tolypocladium capitatum]|uniref:Uncharacterized protein n=1 Tax=Tolypocladium capitatum TaxID=45235 RepID=A0A2K3QNR2_9HYPO|nr:hypothetical protein TCAP_00901 [Tolypocladium capitatum]